MSCLRTSQWCFAGLMRIRTQSSNADRRWNTSRNCATVRFARVLRRVRFIFNTSARACPRTVFPTFLDAAGANGAVPAGHTIDGASLLCLVRDPSGASCNNGAGWRSVLDLEHSTCYNETNHWVRMQRRM